MSAAPSNDPEHPDSSLPPVSAQESFDPPSSRAAVPDPLSQAGPRYHAVRLHAEGGLGEVHVAQDSELDRAVALKRIKPSCATDERNRTRFLREAAITARLEHPGIVPVYGLVRDAEGRPAYAMRFVEGDTFKQASDRYHAKPSRRTFRQLLGHFVSACNAIAYAHSKGVIHRDIKPANILLGQFGETLVVDWGLAKRIDGAGSSPSSDDDTVTASSADAGEATVAGQVLGTPAYMSPEQAAGRWDVVGPASDIYGLGATLYYLLSGRAPFSGKSTQEVLASVQRGELVPPRHWNRNAPAALQSICLEALALDPARRYATATDLARDVENWLADEPVTAYAEPWHERAGRWARRHRTLVAATAGLLLTTAVGLAIGLAAVERERRQTARERDDKELALIAEARARERTLAALRSLSDDLVEQQLARRGQMTLEDREFLRKVLEHYDSFAALRGDDAESRAIRAEGLYRVGRVRHRLGELREAEEAYRQALDLQKQLVREFPARPGFRHNQVTSQIRLAGLIAARAKLTEAEETYRDALSVQKQLVADHPNQPEYSQQLTRVLLSLGVLLKDTARPELATAFYQDALANQKQLVTDFPKQPDYRELLANCHLDLGTFLASTNHLADAESFYRESVRIESQQAADFPARPESRNGLARSLTNLGNLLRDTNRPLEAEAVFGEALKLLKTLTADFPTRPEYREELARTHLSLGTVWWNARRLTEAETAYRAARALLRRMADDFPTVPGYGNALAGSLVNLAGVLNDRKDFVAAREMLDEALPLHLAALKANPKHSDFRQFYRNYLLISVTTAAGLRDSAGAVRAAVTVRDLGWDLAGDAYDAACTLAQCVPLAAKADAAISWPRRRHASIYAESAMVLLKHAIAKGFKDKNLIRKDSDLDPLRSREDFKNLLRELETKPQ